MTSWLKWLLPSAVVAAGLTVVTGVAAFRSIADDVVSRTASELKAQGHGWVTVETNGRDLILGGTAPEPKIRDLALAAADRVFGVRVVADRTAVLPLAAPYVFSITRDGAKLVLDGAVPDRATRDAVLAAVAKGVPGAVVDDRLTLARGAPASFAAATAFALGQISALTRGTVSVTDTAYAIAGDPVDWATYRRLEADLSGALPAGLTLATDGLVDPAPKPYRLQVRIAGTSVRLEGHVPDAAAGARLLAGVGAIWGGAIDDRTKAAPGAPPGFVDTVLTALPGLARLADGRLELVDTSLKVSGIAPTGALGDQIRASIQARLPGGFSLGVTELTVVPPAVVAPEACRAGLSAVQVNGKIRFETGNARLDAEDTAVLDKLVVASLKCGAARVIVEGHTDDVGTADANKILSESRAAAVVDYLVAAGIAADRLSAVGYGDTRPVGDNATEEGRQSNRRIDFTVE